RRRFLLQFFKKPLFVDLRETSRRRAEILPKTVAIPSVFFPSSVAPAPFERSTISRGAVSALESVVFAGFALISVALAPSFARRGVGGTLFETAASVTITPVGVRVERGASFAAVRLRVAPFGVSSVVSFRAFLGQSHPFVFRSRLQSQGFAPALKSAEALKSAPKRSAQRPERFDNSRTRPAKGALAASARRIKRNIRRRF
ncbi:MAG: hypothetical protein IJN32_07015, partial [Thermoguttaceae bacterium]|nr:hypothetical protein [Thermoguttaceae bacterium]